MKSLITLLLATTLVLLPTVAKAQSNPPPVEQKSRLVGGVVLGILVIAVGTLIITGLKKMSNKLPPMHAYTNAPPDDITKTYPVIHDSGDTNPVNSVMFQESKDLQTWTETLTVSFTESETLVSQAGNVIATNPPCYIVPGTNGETLVYFDLRGIPIKKKPIAFFRLMSQ